MKIFSKTIIATVFAITAFGAAPASAAIVTYSDTQVMTEDGQDFTFNFENLLPSDGTGGTITIASGKSTSIPGAWDGIDLDSSSEYFELAFDGIAQGTTYNCTGLGGHTAIADAENPDTSNCKFSLTIALSGEELDTLLADQIISIGVSFSNGVIVFFDFDEVIVELEYHAVPVPAALPLFVAGIAGIGAVSRRRKKLAVCS